MARGKTRAQYLGSAGYVESVKEMTWDFLYRASTSKDPLYNLGDRVALADGRVFRYAKCGNDIGFMKMGVCSYNLLVAEYTTPCCKPTAAVAVGANSAAFTCTAGIGAGRDGIIDLDELRGGYISFYHGQDRQQRGIIGNTAKAALGTSITLYWDAGLVTALEAADLTEILANPYSDVRTAGNASGYASVLGMPNVLATTGQYFWIQTWGICRVSPIAGALGSGPDIRQLMFAAGNGGIRISQDSIVDGGYSEQHAGFIIEKTDGGAESAAPFVNLQINP